MMTKAHITLTAIFLAAGVTVAAAETTPDHSAHHPGDAAATAGETAVPPPGTPMPTTPPAGGMPMGETGGSMPMMDMSKMMGGDMGAMMRMRRGMMAADGDRMVMMPFEHVEGRIAFFKAELGITDAELPQWNAFAAALRASAKIMRDTMAKSMAAELPATAPEKADAMMQMMTAHLDAMKTTAAALKTFYSSLTANQQKILDDLLSGPMGRM